MKRLLTSLALILGVSVGLLGCNYDSGYSYVRPTAYAGDAYYGADDPVIYDDGYYGGGFDPGWYGAGCCFVGGVYGHYYGGGGYWHGGYYHGGGYRGYRGGGYHGGGGFHGGMHGGGHVGGHGGGGRR